MTPRGRVGASSRAKLLDRALRPARNRTWLAVAGLVAAGLLLAASAALLAARWELLAKRDRGDLVMAVRKAGSLLGDGLAAGTFGQADIEGLRSLPGVRDAAPVRRAEFQILGRVEFGSGGYESLLFLESIPDPWLDKPFPPSAEGGGEAVPILVGETFLFIYNTAFAPANGLPELREGYLGLIPIDLYLSGPLGSVRLKARVVGTTSRMDSILVPDSLLAGWNESLAGQRRNPTGKLLLKADPAKVGSIEAHCRDRGMVAERNAFAQGPLASFLGMMGLILMALAAFAALQALSQFLMGLELELRDSEGAHETLLLWGHPRKALRKAREGRLRRIIGLSFGIGIAICLAASVFLPGELRREAPLPLGAALGALAVLHGGAYLLARGLLLKAPRGVS